mgnify:CR=1 FL=1
MTTVSIELEIPEALYNSVTEYVKSHEHWSQERVGQAALSLFLMQNGNNQPHVNEIYLDSLFGTAP